MATVRFYRGHWVADYYDTNKRRRIEQPKGHFENLTDELRAAQALLADRVAEVADGLVHEGYGTFEVAALREAATPATYRDGRLVTNNYRLLISFAVFTGCRAGEILGAAWNHIDWESGGFRVRRAYREGHFQELKTRTSYRSIALPGFLLKELRVWRLACPKSPHDLIFPNLDGRPMSYWNLMARGFHPALKRAGIRRIRFHDLRHTFASLMISNGEDIVRVSRLMGHANASFTFNTYCHMLPRRRDPIGDRLASLVFGNKMETDRDAENQTRFSVAETSSESAI